MREGRERDDKLKFPEVASCFSALTFPNVRNSAVYKREIILQTFCRVLDLTHKWMRIGSSKAGLPLSVVQLIWLHFALACTSAVVWL